MFCIECQKEVEPEFVLGSDIYGPNFCFASSRFFRCPFCANYGESATITEDEFKVIPDARLRKGYNYIDGVLRLIWMQQKASKEEVISEMSRRLYGGSKPYRTRDVASYDEARRAYLIAKKIKEEFFL